MARERNIENPTKVTLYMPEETVKRGKRYASESGSSLSQLITSLVEKEIGDELPVTIKLKMDRWESITSTASGKGMTLEQYLQEMIAGNEDSGD